MNNTTFQSIQGASLHAFIDMKHRQGYAYKTSSYGRHRFDRFLCERTYGRLWLEREIVDSYIQQLSHCNAFSQSKMLSVVRVYSRFLHLRYPQSYILETPPFRVKRSSRFYIYSREELAVSMQAAAALGPKSIRPHTVRTLIVSFFHTYLRDQAGCSPNTIQSYCECIRLLISSAVENNTLRPTNWIWRRSSTASCWPSGIAHILSKHASTAAQKCASLKGKNVTPHTIASPQLC